MLASCRRCGELAWRWDLGDPPLYPALYIFCNSDARDAGMRDALCKRKGPSISAGASFVGGSDGAAYHFYG
jgi:hypothetical protein